MRTTRIKQATKHSHSSRRLTGEASSMSKSAIEDYHGASSVAVPFNWESEPGTPKVNSSREIQLPPLTPPPSYFSAVSSPKSVPKKSAKSLFGSIFAIRAAKRAPELSPVSSYSSSSSSSSSGCSSPLSPMATRPRPSCRRYGTTTRNAEGETENGSSPVSTLRFREGKRRSYSSLFKVLLRDV